MAALPNKNCLCNYNAKDYDPTTHSIPKTTGQAFNQDLVLNAAVSAYTDVSISVDGQYMDHQFNSSSANPFARTGRDALTIVGKISKGLDNSGEHCIFSVRDENLNYLLFNPANGCDNSIVFLHNWQRYYTSTPYVQFDESPNIFAIRVSNGSGYGQSFTDETDFRSISNTWGNKAGKIGFFKDSFSGGDFEKWRGEFYWLYISDESLTTKEIEQVIAFNEGIPFSVEPSDINAAYWSSSYTVSVSADSLVSWTATTNDSWISLTTPTGSGNGGFTVAVAENNNYSDRTGTVTVTSSKGDVLTITVEQEKHPILVYDRPIYRSGNLVMKMYRSGELIYLRLNPPSEEPEPPTPPEPTYQWVEVTADFDRSLSFTKVRWDFSKSWNDGFFSELPNINCDNKGWTSITGAEWGYAGQYTMNLSAKKCYIRNQSAGNYSLYDMYAITTQVDTNIYEYEYSVPLYWGGVSNSSLYNNGLGLYVYVEVNPTNE